MPSVYVKSKRLAFRAVELVAALLTLLPFAFFAWGEFPTGGTGRAWWDLTASGVAVLIAAAIGIGIVLWWMSFLRKPLDERRVRRALGIVITVATIVLDVFVGQWIGNVQWGTDFKLNGLPVRWENLLDFFVAVLGILLFVGSTPVVVRWLALPRCRTAADRLKTASTLFGITAVALFMTVGAIVIPAANRSTNKPAALEFAAGLGPLIAAYLYYKLGMWCARRILGDPNPAERTAQGPSLNG